MTMELIGLSYSPWTEKARWALDHHRLSYRYREHLILFGEISLCIRLRCSLGKVTVPALFDGKVRLSDSCQIARYANERGEGEDLFPANRYKEIEECNSWSEAALSAGRALLIDRMKNDSEARREALPPWIPRSLQVAFGFLASIGLSYVDRSFGASANPPETNRQELRKILSRLRTVLDRSKTGYLLERFSYADIAMAAIFQVVDPVSDRFVPLGPATRRCFTDDPLRREFQDLIEWRNGIYERYR